MLQRRRAYKVLGVTEDVTFAQLRMALARVHGHREVRQLMERLRDANDAFDQIVQELKEAGRLSPQEIATMEQIEKELEDATWKRQLLAAVQDIKSLMAASKSGARGSIGKESSYSHRDWDSDAEYIKVSATLRRRREMANSGFMLQKEAEMTKEHIAEFIEDSKLRADKEYIKALVDHLVATRFLVQGRRIKNHVYAYDLGEACDAVRDDSDGEADVSVQ